MALAVGYLLWRPGRDSVPARPVWIISPEWRSSRRKTGQLATSAFASENSILVAITRNELLLGTTRPKSGTVPATRRPSAVRTSSRIADSAMSIVEVGPSTFLTKRAAVTDSAVW